MDPIYLAGKKRGKGRVIKGKREAEKEGIVKKRCVSIRWMETGLLAKTWTYMSTGKKKTYVCVRFIRGKIILQSRNKFVSSLELYEALYKCNNHC
jgi:hypothetical protein